ncbi:hypothetical protein WDZ11_15880 [Roseomonas mucosa]|uniref:hypothetical protein n=1 Tax=Roseomonas mucosa TaxID=207340 RepID=UPI0030D2261C
MPRNPLILAALFPLIFPGLPAWAESPGSPAAESGMRMQAMIRAPLPLAARDVLFAHARQAGESPDFDALAEALMPPPELASPVPSARRQRHDAAFAELRRKLRAEYESFDPDRPYLLRIRTAIGPYDPRQGGLPVALNGTFWVRDPTWRSPGFGLRFDNALAVGTLPVANEAAAEKLLESVGLDPRTEDGWRGILEVSLVLGGALPQPAGMKSVPIAAHLLTARLVREDGTPIHDFGRLPGPLPSARPGGPVLRSALLEGLRLGMPLEEARAALRRRGFRTVGGAFFADGAVASAAGRPGCHMGLVADRRAFGEALNLKADFTACIALHRAPDPGPEAGEDAGMGAEAQAGTREPRLGGITALRFLPGESGTALRRALERRFGPSLADAEGEVLWIGRDPEAPHDAPMVELRAEFVPLAEGGPRHGPGLLLGLELEPYRAGSEAS